MPQSSLGMEKLLLGVLVPWVLLILSPSPRARGLSSLSAPYSNLHSMEPEREPSSPPSPGLLKAYILPELCFTDGAFKSSNPI